MQHFVVLPLQLEHPVLDGLKVGLCLLVADELADGEVVLLQNLPLALQVGQLHVRLVVVQRLLEAVAL